MLRDLLFTPTVLAGLAGLTSLVGLTVLTCFGVGLTAESFGGCFLCSVLLTGFERAGVLDVFLGFAVGAGLMVFLTVFLEAVFFSTVCFFFTTVFLLTVACFLADCFLSGAFFTGALLIFPFTFFFVWPALLAWEGFFFCMNDVVVMNTSEQRLWTGRSEMSKVLLSSTTQSIVFDGNQPAAVISCAGLSGLTIEYFADSLAQV